MKPAPRAKVSIIITTQFSTMHASQTWCVRQGCPNCRSLVAFDPDESQARAVSTCVIDEQGAPHWRACVECEVATLERHSQVWFRHAPRPSRLLRWDTAESGTIARHEDAPPDKKGSGTAACTRATTPASSAREMRPTSPRTRKPNSRLA